MTEQTSTTPDAAAPQPKPRADSEKGANSTKRYLRRNAPGAGDRFLDVGANICSVANWAAGLGCESVLAYEPLPLAVAQARPAPQVVLVPRAITSDGRDVTMGVSKDAVDRNYLCSAHVLKRSASAAQIAFADIASDAVQTVLQAFDPTVVKIDIEGGEYDVLPAAEFGSSVRVMFIEWHGCNSPGQAVLMPALLHRLWRQGFAATTGWARDARFDPRSNFTTLMGVGFWREVLFERSVEKTRNLAALMDGAKRILDSGKWRGAGRLCSDAQLQKLLREEGLAS